MDRVPSRRRGVMQTAKGKAEALGRKAKVCVYDRERGYALGLRCFGVACSPACFDRACLPPPPSPPLILSIHLYAQDCRNGNADTEALPVTACEFISGVARVGSPIALLGRKKTQFANHFLSSLLLLQRVLEQRPSIGWKLYPRTTNWQRILRQGLLGHPQTYKWLQGVLRWRSLSVPFEALGLIRLSTLSSVAYIGRAQVSQQG